MAGIQSGNLADGTTERPGAEFRHAAFDIVDRLRARRRMGDNPTVRIIVDLVLCDGTDAESLARGWLAQADLDALDNDHASAMINVMGLLPELSTEALQDLAEHLRRTDGPQADAE